MEFTKTIDINVSARDVWDVLGNHFDKAQDWLSSVAVSTRTDAADKVEGAPMRGRVCELSTKPNGPVIDEHITPFDDQNMRLGIHVVPLQGNLPIDHTDSVVDVIPTGDSSCRVVWNVNIELKTTGKLLYPAMVVGLKKGFSDILEELKYYTEEGKPHPRKVKAMAAAERSMAAL